MGSAVVLHVSMKLSIVPVRMPIGTSTFSSGDRRLSGRLEPGMRTEGLPEWPEACPNVRAVHEESKRSGRPLGGALVTWLKISKHRRDVLERATHVRLRPGKSSVAVQAVCEDMHL